MQIFTSIGPSDEAGYFISSTVFCLIYKRVGKPPDSPADNLGYTPGLDFIDLPGDFLPFYLNKCWVENWWYFDMNCISSQIDLIV
jgi:hypothetical protein